MRHRPGQQRCACCNPAAALQFVYSVLEWLRSINSAGGTSPASAAEWLNMSQGMPASDRALLGACSWCSMSRQNMLFMNCVSPRHDSIVVPELEASLVKMQAPRWQQLECYAFFQSMACMWLQQSMKCTQEAVGQRWSARISDSMSAIPCCHVGRGQSLLIAAAKAFLTWPGRSPMQA